MAGSWFSSWPHGVTWASARSDQSPEEDGALGGADTQGRAVLEATATHPRVVVAWGSPMVAAGDSPMVAVGGNPMVAAGGSLMVAAGGNPMVVAPTVNGANPVSQKPT